MVLTQHITEHLAADPHEMVRHYPSNAPGVGGARRRRASVAAEAQKLDLKAFLERLAAHSIFRAVILWIFDDQSRFAERPYGRQHASTERRLGCLTGHAPCIAAT